jgi:hypothetical protein
MAFLDGQLQLVPPDPVRNQRLPVNFFFGSRAQDHRGRSIGIILSGTGTDGEAASEFLDGRVRDIPQITCVIREDRRRPEGVPGAKRKPAS